MPSDLQVDNIKDVSATKTLATLSSSAVTLHSDVDIKSTINASGSAPIYACRAWVIFNGLKDTSGSASTSNTNRLINGSGNVASVLRNTTGDYTVNFTTAISDNNYACLITGTNRQNGSGTGYSLGYYSTDSLNASTYTTTSIRIFNKKTDSTDQVDVGDISVVIFR